MADFTVSMMVGTYLDERKRVEESVYTLGKNLENSVISDVHLFIEDNLEGYRAALARNAYPAIEALGKHHQHPKVKVVEFGARPTYQQMFEYANKTFPEGRVVLLSNIDIEYDETLRRLEGYDLTNVFICMSRELGKGCYRAAVSQDTWIWRSPIKIFRSDWTLGLPGGDNRIAHEADAAGFRVINPCISIDNKHHHESRVRHWTHADRIKCAGPYKEVNPCGIEGLPRLK